MNDIVKTDGVSHAFFHHDGAIEQQVISASNGEIFGIISEDMCQMVVPEHLSGSDEGIGQKILWSDDCFLGKRCIFGHQYAESVHGGKGEKIIAGCIDFPEYQGKVNEPMIQFLQNGSLVAADNVEMYQRVLFLQGMGGLNQRADAFCFPGTYVDVARNDFCGTGDFLLRFFQ